MFKNWFKSKKYFEEKTDEQFEEIRKLKKELISIQEMYVNSQNEIEELKKVNHIQYSDNTTLQNHNNVLKSRLGIFRKMARTNQKNFINYIPRMIDEVPVEWEPLDV